MTSFNQRLTNLPASVWQRLTQIDEIKGKWRANAGLGPQLLGRLKRSVLVTSTGASTRLQGAELSDAEVERLILGLTLTVRSRTGLDVLQLRNDAKSNLRTDPGAQAVRGYYDMLKAVFDLWDRNDPELSDNRIKYLHEWLLGYSGKDEHHRGQYRTMDSKVQAVDTASQVVSVLLDTTPPHHIGKQMSELVTWTEEALTTQAYHPLLVIANFVAEFLKIHPFLNGNGRLSRLLTNLLMLHAGYGFVPYVSHERLIEANKTDYYLALRRSQTTFGTTEETIQPWLEFFLGICHTQAKQAMALLTDVAVDQLLSPAQLKVWNYLLTVDEAAPREIAAATGMPLPTVASALGRLLGLGKVERLGLGSATRYRCTEVGEARRAA